MARVAIGYRRLYESPGCALEGTNEYSLSVPMTADLSADIYIGPAPRLGPAHESSTSQACEMFTEIFCYHNQDVSADVAEALLNRSSEAQEGLADLARNRLTEYRRGCEILAGSIGLLLNMQFVLDLLDEDYAARNEQGTAALAHIGHHTLIFRTPQIPRDPTILGKVLPQLCAVRADEFDRRARIFQWLRQGRNEADKLFAFLEFFIALETALGGRTYPAMAQSKEVTEIRALILDYAGQDKDGLLELLVSLSTSQAQHPLVKKLKKLITKYGGDTAAKLHRTLDRLCSPPDLSISQRFDTVVDEIMRVYGEQSASQLRADAEAFNRFTQMRNSMVHRGEQSATIETSLADGDVRHLDELATRYIAFFMFPPPPSETGDEPEPP